MDVCSCFTFLTYLGGGLVCDAAMVLAVRADHSQLGNFIASWWGPAS